MFGEPVGFSIDGGGTRKSFIGLLISLLIIGTLIPYSFKKFERLIEYDGVWVSFETDPEGKQITDRTQIHNFTVGFQLSHIIKKEFLNIEEYFSIVSFNIVIDDNRPTFIPITTRPCTDEDLQKSFIDFEGAKQFLSPDAMICLDGLSEIELYGITTDPT